MKRETDRQINQLYKKTGAKNTGYVSTHLNTGTLKNKLAHSFNCKNIKST